MKWQELPYSCGAATVRNTLRCFDEKVGEKRIRRLAGTVRAGTTEEGVIKVLKHFELKVELILKSSKTNAYLELNRALKAGYPVIICAQNFNHWALVTARFKPDQYLVIDSNKTKKVKKENQVIVMNKDTFDKFWHHRTDGYYGIIVMP